MEKDQLEIQTYKSKIINSLKGLDKDKLFEERKKKDITLFNKLFKILNNGRKK